MNNDEPVLVTIMLVIMAIWIIDAMMKSARRRAETRIGMAALLGAEKESVPLRGDQSPTTFIFKDLYISKLREVRGKVEEPRVAFERQQTPETAAKYKVVVEELKRVEALGEYYDWREDPLPPPPLSPEELERKKLEAEARKKKRKVIWVSVTVVALVVVGISWWLSRESDMDNARKRMSILVSIDFPRPDVFQGLPLEKREQFLWLVCHKVEGLTNVLNSYGYKEEYVREVESQVMELHDLGLDYGIAIGYYREGERIPCGWDK